MGRWKKGKNKKKPVGNERNKERKDQPTNYVALVRENKDFEKYYKAQNLVPEGEWDEFMTTLKSDLPAALRLTGSNSHAKALSKIMKERYFDPLSKLEEVQGMDGEEPIKPLKPLQLPWYPDGLAWQLNLTRRNIKKCESYWKLHQFLISETETGNISRQETVSMIPPIVLEIQPHHKVLDMCAAPGSKTTQLIEFLHRSDDESRGSMPPGVIVANDSDNKRCYMLTHQVNRLQSPSIMVTNHDAAFMPNILHTRKDKSVGPIKFDRILCDVPCSGDATLRKNFDVWNKWNPINGTNLHGLQLRIARRGLEMLAVGGRMVYSTCSLNPLENEAVIARLIQDTGFAVKLVDVKDQLPGLKITPGMENWTLMTKELEIMKTSEDIPPEASFMFNKHLFPPSDLIKPKLELQKCVRVLPHHQDTGGFFVAVIEKVSLLPGEKSYSEKTSNESSAKEESSAPSQKLKPPPKKKPRFGFKEEPYYYFGSDDSLWPELKAFFEFKEDVDPTLFLTRTNDGKRRIIYFTNALVKDIVNLNQERMKIINTGVRALVRTDNKGAVCGFRLAQDGSQVMLPLIKARKISVTRDDVEKLLLNSDVEDPPEINTLDPKTQEICNEIVSGSAAFEYSGGTGINNSIPITFQLVGWKGKQSVRAYVAKNDRLHYLRLIDGDTSKFDKNKFEEQRELDKKNAIASVENGNKVDDQMDCTKAEEKSTDTSEPICVDLT